MLFLSFLAYIAGWLLTEVAPLPFNFKPFNCRPCMTFWLTAAANACCAFVVSPLFIDLGIVSETVTALYGVAGAGVLLGFMNFLYVKLKYKIYE